MGQGGFLFAERGKLHTPAFFKNQFNPALQLQNQIGMRFRFNKVNIALYQALNNGIHINAAICKKPRIQLYPAAALNAASG